MILANKNDTRTVIIMWVWITYLILTVFYFVSFNLIEPVYSKLIYLVSSCLTLLYCAFDLLKGFKHYVHRAFLVLCLLSIAFNFMYMILYFVVGIDNYKVKIATFITVEILTASFIFISGKNRGLFKHEEDML